MKREKTQGELMFEEFLRKSKEREEELLELHRSSIAVLEAQEKELEGIQESLNKNERAILKNLEAERLQLQGYIENLEIKRDAELDLMGEKIEKTGTGFNESLDKKKDYDARIEKLKAELAPQLEKMELLILKAQKKVKEGELAFLDKKQIWAMGQGNLRKNLDLHFKNKIKDLEWHFSNISSLESIMIGQAQKLDEIHAISKKIFELEEGPDTQNKRIIQAGGKRILMRDIGGKK